MKKIIFACDHAGLELKDYLCEELSKKGYEVFDFGTKTKDRVDYPVVAIGAAEKVAGKEFDYGILCCGTGQGMAICANKVKGIRAAHVSDLTNAKLAKVVNDANIITFGQQITTPIEALRMCDAFLNAAFQADERPQKRIYQIEDYENGRKMR